MNSETYNPAFLPCHVELVTATDAHALDTSAFSPCGRQCRQERGFGVAEQMAQNEGVGNFTNAGIGMGAMMGVGGAVGGVMGGMMNDTVTAFTTVPATNKFCDNCGTQLASDVMFCEECGTPVASKKTCANCGYEFERPGKFCPKCGTKREG